MAKKNAKKVEVKEVSRIDLGNGTVLVKYEDGTFKILVNLELDLDAEKAQEIFGSDEEDDDEEEEDDDEEEEDDDSDDDDDDSEDDDDEDDEEEDDDEEEEDDDEEEEEEEITPEALAGMDFEELEDVCDEKELDTDPDDFDEDDVEKLRKAVAKELGITLPKAPAKSDKKKKGKK